MASSGASPCNGSRSPCAACKQLRRKCVPECAFAPYFPPEQPLKFANVHRIFGASNVSKILIDLPLWSRPDAVKSLVYEAEARIQDPLHGCVQQVYNKQERISVLQQEIRTLWENISELESKGIRVPVDLGLRLP